MLLGNAMENIPQFLKLRCSFLPRLLLAGLVACLLPAGAQKAPDFVAGERAYRQGDVRAAIAKLRPLADSGDAAAQALLGEILDRAERDEEAVAYYRKSAEQGNPDGAYGLAGMMAVGEGIAKDPAGARSWFEKAAQAGHEGAVRSLAMAYIEGTLGISAEARQSEDALKWIRKAVDLNIIAAIDRLAKAYRGGEFGLSPDAKMAETLEAKSRALRGLVPNKGKKDASKNK